MSAEQHHGEPGPVRVALSNDYEIALLGLAEMLARHPGDVRVVDLTTLPKLPHEADVILYDTFGRLPEEDEKLHKVVTENSAKVVVYSWDDYPEEVARRHGAAGYLSKAMGSAELVEAIVAIHRGDSPRPVERSDDSDESDDPQHTWPGQAVGLSQRESEILTFIARGLSNEEIARRAFLSINTVKTYIRTAYRKIGVQSRSQAVVWTYRNGFLPTDDTGL